MIKRLKKTRNLYICPILSQIFDSSPVFERSHVFNIGHSSKFAMSIKNMLNITKSNPTAYVKKEYPFVLPFSSDADRLIGLISVASADEIIVLSALRFSNSPQPLRDLNQP